jgi:sugar phosphate isomerase/epimerase
VLLNRVGRVPGEGNDAQFTRLVEALTAIGTYGDRIGARLAAQTGSEPPEDLARLIAALPEQSVGVDLYPAGLIMGGQSPRDAVDVLGPYVLHVHASDAVRDASGRANEVTLGRGSADMPELLGKLTEFDYRGWVTIERRESPDPITEIENAVAYLRAL